MHPYSFIISLRARHPTDDLNFMNYLLKRQPSSSWVAGDDRKTPKGTLLGGKRDSSYWVVRLTEEETDSETWQVEDYIEKILKELSQHKQTFESFIKSGGMLELYISLYGTRNYGIELNSNLLVRLGNSHLELILDIYQE